MVETQEALSVEVLLRSIPKYEVNNGQPLFGWQYSKVPPVVGAIGGKGSGKTGTISVIALIDDLLRGRPVWSNLEIKADFAITDEVAQRYGCPHGGTVSFASQPVDRERLLNFDPEYHDGTLVLQEINVEYAESRRSQSNVNLWFNDLDQQLRKLNLRLYYDIINEMWIDARLRDTTDIFIKCEDPAISPYGLRHHVREGIQTKWTIYDITGKLTGVPYLESRKPLAPRYLALKRWWGIWDTKKRQKKEQGQYGFGRTEDEWEWLDEALTEIFQKLREEGRKEILRPELFSRLGVEPSERVKVGTELMYRYHLQIRRSHDNTFYLVPQGNLSRPESMRRNRRAVGAPTA